MKISLSALILASVVIVGHHTAHAKCSISATQLQFGNYDVFAPSDTNVAPTTLTFSCTKAGTVYIAILQGTASSSFSPRSLAQGSQPELDYYLYTNASHTTIWGDGTSGSGVFTRSVSKNVQYTATLYGRIVAGQDVNVGTYSEPTALTVRIYDSSFSLQDSATMAVTATVVQTCKISTSALAFGNYDPVSANKSTSLTVDGTNAVSVRCTRGSTSSTISLGKGLQPNPASSFTRYLASGANRLNYQIYTSAARTTIWGDGTNGTSTRTVPTPTSFLTSATFSAYGTIPGAQDVAAGTYNDTISATVNF